MAENGTSSQAQSAVVGKRGAKHGLPAIGLRTACEMATKLWGVARRASTPNQVFGAEIGQPKASGGAWRARVAVLRGFGLVVVTGNEIGLSDLGYEVVKECDEQGGFEARRKALLSLKAYQQIVDNFDQTVLPVKEKLATRLKYEYGRSDDAALIAAEELIDSLRFANMLDVDFKLCREGVGTTSEASRNDPLENGKGPQPTTRTVRPRLTRAPTMSLVSRSTLRSTRHSMSKMPPMLPSVR